MNTTSIDTVIDRLEAIMQECIREKNKAGFFTALYHKVTCKVKEALLNGEFEDSSRMEKLDTIFAGRYIDAWEGWKRNRPISQSWAVAFKEAKKPLALVLQHMMLGVNAHINLDLGIAAAETCKDGDIHAMRRDFVRINAILNAVLLDVLKDLQRVSPLSSLLGLHSRNRQSMLINFTIEVARDGAWCFAEDLWHLTEAEREAFITERDKEIYQLGQNMAETKGLLKLTAIAIRIFEWNNAAKVIHVLRESSKVKFHAETTAVPAPVV
ncbi:MAG TPA: DUF5995 family protein [Flavisolibacter sp.]|jgi:hypothetical protein|nr:DUF5995 family protein [Flavisolibacter sp.]